MTSAPSIPSETTQEALLHCPNLQGVILGVGLHMIEKTFSQGRDHNSCAEKSGRTPPSKKRKTDDNPPFLKGKGAVKGTGYAGNVQEDVSERSLRFKISSFRWLLIVIAEDGPGCS